MIFDFMIEIEASAISLAPHEAATRIGTTPEQAVEIGEPLDTESLGEPRARQAHELAQRAHAHAEQTSVFFFRPAQRGERQRFEPRRQHVRVGDETARAGPRRRERSQCGGSEREAWLHLGLRQHRICTAGIAQLAAQLAQAAEQRDARLDLEQQAIRRLDGNLRRERGGDAGQPSHEREFKRCIARPRIEMRNERERGSQGHADLHSGRLRVRIRVDDARVAIRSIHDHERRGRSGRARLRRSNGQQRQLRHMRRDPQFT